MVVLMETFALSSPVSCHVGSELVIANDPSEGNFLSGHSLWLDWIAYIGVVELETEGFIYVCLHNGFSKVNFATLALMLKSEQAIGLLYRPTVFADFFFFF